jgi:hypothetical protein
MAPMPPKKNAIPPPVADADDTGADQGADAGGDEGGEDDQESGPSGKVIATIVDAGDGTFILYAGDEPEGGDGDGGGEEGSESEEGDEGAEQQPPEDGDESEEGEGEDEGAEPEHFESVGPLLKRVLDLLNEAEASNGSGEHAFKEGYEESHNPTPKK